MDTSTEYHEAERDQSEPGGFSLSKTYPDIPGHSWANSIWEITDRRGNHSCMGPNVSQLYDRSRVLCSLPPSMFKWLFLTLYGAQSAQDSSAVQP